MNQYVVQILLVPTTVHGTYDDHVTVGAKKMRPSFGRPRRQHRPQKKTGWHLFFGAATVEHYDTFLSNVDDYAFFYFAERCTAFVVPDSPPRLPTVLGTATSSEVASPGTGHTEEQLIVRAKEIISKDINFGVADDGECLAEDFLFIGAQMRPVKQKGLPYIVTGQAALELIGDGF